jgi:hypothetical protein
MVGRYHRCRFACVSPEGENAVLPSRYSYNQLQRTAIATLTICSKAAA